MIHLNYLQKQRAIIALAAVYITSNSVQELRMSDEVKESARNALWTCVLKHVGFFKEMAAVIMATMPDDPAAAWTKRNLEAVGECLEGGSNYALSSALCMAQVFEVVLGIHETDED